MTTGGARSRPEIAAGVLVAAVTVVAFHALLLGGFGFVNYDDPQIVYQNPEFLREGGPRLSWMFAVTPAHMGHYQPLTWMSLALDMRLFGLANPSAWHVVNLVLHVATAVSVFVLFRQLLSAASSERGADDSGSAVTFAAGIGALLFAVHPLRVESVAWITERRDVLSGLFYVLALVLYVRRARGEARTPGSLVPALAVFALSMLAKAWGITFVAVLLLLDFYPLRRFATERPARLLGEKAPFLVVSAFFAWQAWRAQDLARAALSWEEHGLAQRVAQAAYGLCFYVGKTLWPDRLSCLYQLEQRPPGLDALGAVHVAAMVIVAGVSVAAVVMARRRPWITVSWFAYAVVVSPVLGFNQSGAQKVADRYTYLACLPFALLAAAALVRAHRGRETGRTRRPVAGAAVVSVLAVVPVLAVVSVAALVVLTIRYTPAWRNSVTLWEHATRSGWPSYIAEFNRGRAYEEAGRIDDAIEWYRKSLVTDPRQAKARMNVGLLLARQKRDYDGAIREFEALLEYHPKHAPAFHCIGLSHTRRNRTRAAIEAFRRAVALDPDYLDAHEALSHSYRRAGRYAKAEEHRAAAVRLRRAQARH